MLISFLNKDFIFAILHFEGKVLSFINRFIMSARWIAITGAPSLTNLVEIWFIPEVLRTSKVSKILSTVVVTSTLS